MAARAIDIAAYEKYGFDYPEKIETKIFSIGTKSPLYGAQYLHAPIDGITPPQGHLIDYQLFGTTEDYRRKVYGDEWDGTVSPEDLGREHWGWDLRETYSALWLDYAEEIVQAIVDPDIVQDLLDEGWLVISSIPAPAICKKSHRFRAQDIVAAGDAPELGIFLPYRSLPHFSVWCNGDPDGPAWYRQSNIFGHVTVEWPVGTKVPISSAAVVPKPLSHDCDCWDERVLRIGRYGKWEKGVLTNHAYEDTLKFAEENLQ